MLSAFSFVYTSQRLRGLLSIVPVAGGNVLLDIIGYPHSEFLFFEIVAN
jgi:hypothetical protein